MRFANEAQLEGIADVQARASRINWVKNFAYPAPRTFTYSEIVTPTRRLRDGHRQQRPQRREHEGEPAGAHHVGLRLATSQREGMRSNISALMLDMLFNPERVQPAADIGGAARRCRTRA